MSTYSYRITTNGVMRSYRSNLNNSYRRLNTATERVQTHREYNTYAADPTSANRAFQLRRQLWRTNDAIDNTNYAIGIYQSAFSAMDSICDGSTNSPGFDKIKEQLELLNGATGDGRVPLGQTLLSAADSIVQMLNCQYGDNFVFAGADGHNVPFTWGENTNGDKVLLYRGIDVNTPDPEMINKFEEEAAAAAEIGRTQPPTDIKDNKGNVIGQATVTYEKDGPTGNTIKTTTNTYYKLDASGNLEKDGNGNPVPDTTKTVKDTENIPSPENAFEKKYGMSYQDAQTNYEKLKEMAGETTYVDIGIGFEQEEGVTVPTSAYNTALSGLNILGFGVDGDGDSVNMVSMLRELGEIARNCDPGTGAFSTDRDEAGEIEARANTLVIKLRSALDRVSERHVEITAKTEYLNSNVKLLTTNRDALDQQRADVEQIDPALAIQEMNYANYCYQAALKIGNSLLSQSLIDYMN